MSVVPTYDLDVYQGDDEEWYLQPKDSDGNFWDLTGYTGSAELKSNRSDTSAVLAFTVTIDNANANSALHFVRFSLSNAQTSTLSEGTYYWDLELVKAGKVKTIVQGSVKVTRDITNRAT